MRQNTWYTPLPRQWTFLVIIAFALVLLGSRCATAQSGSITGIVTDKTSSAVTGASISVLSETTGILRNTVTDGSGYFTVSLLSQGIYTVTISAKGFQQLERKGVQLEQSQVLRLDTALTISEVVTSIEVVQTAPALDRETAAVNTTLETKSIRELPLNGRSSVGFLNLVPGIRGLNGLGGFSPSAYGDGEASISGAPPSTISWLFDGIADENQTSGGPAVTPSVDATAEVHIYTHTPSAEYGRTAGGVVAYVSKSGTNKYHGSIWEFAENSVFNSNNFFSKRAGSKIAPYNQNQYGATTGGPIIPNRLFFFANWEGFRRSTQSQSFYTVPTDLQKSGDFSQTFNSSGQQITIYDPLTTTKNADGTYTRTAFEGNVIPSSRMNNVAKLVEAYYPEPNVTNTSITGINNYLTHADTSYVRNDYGIRLDYYLTPTRQLAGRYTQSLTPTHWPQPFGDDNIATTGTSKTTYIRNSAFISYSDALSSNLLTEMRVGLNRFGIDRNPTSLGFDVTKIGLPSSFNAQQQLQIFPYFYFGTRAALGSQPGDAATQRGYAYSLNGSVTYIRSKHNIKTGFDGRLYQWNSFQGPGLTKFYFDQTWTKGPSATAAATNGVDFASFLLGNPSYGVLYRYQFYEYSTYYYGGYVQDDWKVTRRLTANVGLRWDHELGTTARHNNIANFDPKIAATDSGVSLTGGLIYPGTNGISRGNRDTTWGNCAPRLGLVYELTPSTVVRAGFSISYLPTTGIFVRLGDTGFSSTNTYVTSLDGVTPTGSLSNPFPNGITQPTGSSLGALTGLGTDIKGNVRNLVTGTSQQWGLSVQRQIGTWTVEAGYSASHGLHLPTNYSYGHLNQNNLSLGSSLLDQVTNPYAGIISTGSLASATIQRGVALRDYPQFTSVTSMMNWGGSNYQAGTLRIQRKYSTGLSLLAAYTWSKYLDNTLGNGSNTFSDTGSNDVQNWDNLKAEKAISTSSQPHRLVVSGGYDVPTLANKSRMLRSALSGWRINGILSAYTGDPIGIYANSPTYGGYRQNLVGNPSMSHPTVDKWLNSSAFQNISAYTFGNSPRNLPHTFSQPTVNLDTAISRTIPIVSFFKTEFRFEAFNTLNSTTFGAPASTFGNSDFGVISGIRAGTSPRVLQFGFKGYF